jgi:ubiquinone/menaquinone biosynthesis C-methylase UbiE
MLKKLLHKLLAFPLMYNLLQTFFGVQKKKQILRNALIFNIPSPIIVDVGGGTGLYADIWPKNSKYICLDNDLIKLKGYQPNHSSEYKLCGDATQIPLNTNTADYLFSSSMSHHIPEDLLEKMMSDLSRVLKPTGSLIFIDAILIPKSHLNNFLWSLDRGEFPHTSQSLEDIISKYFHITLIKKFSIYYDYIMIIAKKI